MRIDLGCGTHKHHNCLGIDKRKLEDVDLICDFTTGIPLADNSVDFVMANRSLEYSADFHQVMNEIYRISKHLAVVCIVAPYAHSSIHLANPCIRTAFNEYTPFFLTPSSNHSKLSEEFDLITDLLEQEEPKVNFRLIRMEFLYFPKYYANIYEAEDLEALRQDGINVVNEIMYHFVVIKEPFHPHVLEQLRHSPLEEPARISNCRRQLDLQERKSFILNEPQEQEPPAPESVHPVPQSSQASRRRQRSKVLRTKRHKKTRGKRKVS